MSRPIVRGPARSLALLGAALALLAPIHLSAGDAPGKVALFDGKTLDGWKAVDGYKPGEVKVDDGAIALGAGGPLTAVVSTRPKPLTADYELTYEARRTSGSDFFAAATFPVGPSFLTLVNGGWGGSVTGLSSLNGSDASENETNRFVKYENGTWYRFRIRVTKQALRCSVDDKEIIAFRHADVNLKTRIEVRRCEPLGFASYRSAGQIRAVAVRPLTADEVAAVDKGLEAD